MTRLVQGVLIGAIVVVVGVVPVVCYRAAYAHAKRLRPVEPGRVYRSGQLTAAGFADAVERYGIRTIVNVQDDFPDPAVKLHFFTDATVPESELCARLGVRYVALAPDLISRRRIGVDRPRVIDEFLNVMDDPNIYPVLFHCKAGLHRTGILAAVYRMEYHGWSVAEAYRELKAHGFGDRKCTADNDYVKQYVLTYQPGRRQHDGVARARD